MPEQSTEVQVEVTNTSTIAGDAVAQIYIHQQAGSASRPVRQLKGFRRIALQPGETQTLKFSLGKEELTFWSPQTEGLGRRTWHLRRLGRRRLNREPAY